MSDSIPAWRRYLRFIRPNVAADLERYRAFLTSGAIDEQRPETKDAETWPSDVRDAIARVQEFISDNC